MYLNHRLFGPLVVAAAIVIQPDLAPNSQTMDAQMVAQTIGDRTRPEKAADIRPHQPGQESFRSVLPEGIEWEPYPGYPASVHSAVVVGEPSNPGPYTIRVKVPSGVKLMPHRHPEDRVYTVISGVFYIGLGEQFEADKLHAYPPGSVIVLPGGTWHFHEAKSGEYVSQVTAIGPLGLEFKNPEDDLRKQGTKQ